MQSTLVVTADKQSKVVVQRQRWNGNEMCGTTVAAAAHAGLLVYAIDID